MSLSNPVGGALTGTRTASVTIDNITAAVPPTTPPTTPTPTTVVDRTPPAGGLVAVPTSLLKNGVKFQLLRNDRSTALAVLDGVVKKATLAATTFNLALVSKSLRAGTGRTTIVLKPPKALVGKPKKLTIRVRVILIDAAGNRRDLSKTISVKG